MDNFHRISIPYDRMSVPEHRMFIPEHRMFIPEHRMFIPEPCSSISASEILKGISKNSVVLCVNFCYTEFYRVFTEGHREKK